MHLRGMRHQRSGQEPHRRGRGHHPRRSAHGLESRHPRGHSEQDDHLRHGRRSHLRKRHDRRDCGHPDGDRWLSGRAGGAPPGGHLQADLESGDQEGGGASRCWTCAHQAPGNAGAQLGRRGLPVERLAELRKRRQGHRGRFQGRHLDPRRRREQSDGQALEEHRTTATALGSNAPTTDPPRRGTGRRGRRSRSPPSRATR